MNGQKTNAHIGRNVRAIREIRGIKQGYLASTLSFSQQKISKLEKAENIDEEVLSRIADVLQVSVETIINFDEETVINNYVANDARKAEAMAASANFKLFSKIMDLYERLLESEKDKNLMLAMLKLRGNAASNVYSEDFLRGVKRIA